MGQDPGRESSQASWARSRTDGCPGSTKPFSPVVSTTARCCACQATGPGVSGSLTNSLTRVQRPLQHPHRVGTPRLDPQLIHAPQGATEPGTSGEVTQGDTQATAPVVSRGAEPPGEGQAPPPRSATTSPDPQAPAPQGGTNLPPGPSHLHIQVPRSHSSPPTAASTPTPSPAASLWPLIAANWSGVGVGVGVIRTRPSPPPILPHSPSPGQRNAWRVLGLVPAPPPPPP